MPPLMSLQHNNRTLSLRQQGNAPTTMLAAFSSVTPCIISGCVFSTAGGERRFRTVAPVTPLGQSGLGRRNLTSDRADSKLPLLAACAIRHDIAISRHRPPALQRPFRRADEIPKGRRSHCICLDFGLQQQAHAYRWPRLHRTDTSREQPRSRPCSLIRRNTTCRHLKKTERKRVVRTCRHPGSNLPRLHTLLFQGGRLSGLARGQIQSRMRLTQSATNTVQLFNLASPRPSCAHCNGAGL